MKPHLLPSPAGLGSKLLRAALGVAFLAMAVAPLQAQHSVARQWNDLLLDSIRNDNARPTVHARNLFHTSIAMWDAWATYDLRGEPVLFDEDHYTTDPDVELFREEAISFASYRVCRRDSAARPARRRCCPLYDALMTTLGYDKDYTSTNGDTPAAIGNRIAVKVLASAWSTTRTSRTTTSTSTTCRSTIRCSRRCPATRT